MKIAIIGAGYVGLCTGAGFAELGHEVTVFDTNRKKIESIKKGETPVYEKGLKDALKKALSDEKLKAAEDVNEAVSSAEITFICVGTPSKEDGSMDTRYVEQAAKDIGRALKGVDGYHAVVVKSTVLPGTTENIVGKNVEKESGKKTGRDFGLAMNPEFLREGNALQDFVKPDRIVIGEYDKRSGDAVEGLYEKINVSKMRTGIKTAEMIKYASNAFLAAKISFINEIGNICKRVGIDTYEVAKGMGLDKRIGQAFLRAGVGFGGSCFPKDVSALIAFAKSAGVETKLLEEIVETNERQPEMLVKMLKRKMPGLKGKRIAVLGLAFKADTDDVRESRAINVVGRLLEEGAEVKAYDPKGMDNFRRIFPQIQYCSTSKEALENSDAALILTDWEEFKGLVDKDFYGMKGSVIIEGRRVLDKRKVKGFEGICW